MNEWINAPDDITPYVGFVYMIKHITSGKYYVGLKQFYRAVRRKPLKGNKRVRKDKVESDWKSYYGSSNTFKEYVESEGKNMFTRTIMSLHKSKSGLAYGELKLQMKLDVLRDPLSFNGMINVRLNKILD